MKFRIARIIQASATVTIIFAFPLATILGLHEQSWASFFTMFLFATIIGFTIIIVLALLLMLVLFMHRNFDNFLDYLSGRIRQDPSPILWTAIIVLATFGALVILRSIILPYLPEENLKNTIEGMWLFEVALLVVFFFSSTLLFTAFVRYAPKLSDKLKAEITPWLVWQHPQDATRRSFILLEQQLRERLGNDVDLHGKGLIDAALGEKGKLIYSNVRNEQVGLLNLVNGIYAAFRNPRMHRPVEDDEKMAAAIIASIDLAMYLIDQCEDRIQEENTP